MNFLTAQYRAEGESRISLVVQHFEFREEEICFACLSGRNGWTESLYDWFRREVLGKRKGKSGRRLEKVENSLRKQLLGFEEPNGSERDMLQYSLTGVLCIGEEFVGFEQGKMGIFCLNTAFGRAHIEPLGENKEREIYVGRKIYVGSLQEDVGLLLVTTEMFRALDEKQMSESLFVGEMNREWQMYSRLGELVNEATSSGMSDSGAILVRSCKETKTGETVNMPSETAWEEGQWLWKQDGQSESDFGSGRSVEGYRGSNVSSEDFVWGRKLGEGVFARVYQVRHGKTGEVFACKKSDDIAMLWREYCLGRELEHPLFPQMYNFWQEGSDGFLLMEYVPGSNVKQLLQRRGKFSAQQTIRLGMELAEGLLYLHEWKYPCLFRDVKPENIMIRQDGRVKLLDLGCACRKDTRVASRAGSPGYGAPEQFENGSVLHVTCDVYGLGKTLEEILGRGRRKRPAKKTVSCFFQKGEFWLRRKLIALCKQCTLEDASRRIPDMRMLLSMLAKLQAVCGGFVPVGKRVRVTALGGKKWKCLKNIWERGYKTLDV